MRERSSKHFQELRMPKGDDRKKPPNPESRSRPGTAKGPGAGARETAGAGAPKAKGAGSKGGITPKDVDKPPQKVIVAAAVGDLIGVLVGALDRQRSALLI
jgi:hypothetical protein